MEPAGFQEFVMQRIDELSERERDVLALMATGATDRQIADHLSLSINTVKTHARSISQAGCPEPPPGG